MSTALTKKPKSATAVALLPKIAEFIRARNESLRGVSQEATVLMLEIGVAMEKAKSELPHGQLKKWVEANTGVKYRQAHNYHRLALIFIKSQHVADDEMFLLVDPANSKKAVAERLRLMALDFLGEKTQGELFEEYSIQFREPVPIKHAPEPALKPGETLLGRDADQRIGELQKMMFERCVEDATSELPYLDPRKLKMFLDTVILTKNAIEDQIKAG